MAKTLNDRKLDGILQAFCLHFDYLLKQFAKAAPNSAYREVFGTVLLHQLVYYNALPPVERMNLYANNSKVLDELIER